MWIAALGGATNTSGYCLGFSNEFRFFEYLALTFDGTLSCCTISSALGCIRAVS